MRTDLVDVQESDTVFLNRMDKIYKQDSKKKVQTTKEIRPTSLKYSLVFNHVSVRNFIDLLILNFNVNLHTEYIYFS